MTAPLRSIERAQVLLNLSPTRDGFEVYSVGRVHTLPPSAVFYVCIGCRDMIGSGARIREIRTRRVGTSWESRMVHYVHEVCWLKAYTVSGRERLIAGRSA